MARSARARDQISTRSEPRPGGGAIRAAGEEQDRRAAHEGEARGQVHPARGEPERGHRRCMIRDASRDILVAWPRARARSLRAILFDAGNTLVRMNYAAIAGQLAVLGRPVTPEAVQQRRVAGAGALRRRRARPSRRVHRERRRPHRVRPADPRGTGVRRAVDGAGDGGVAPDLQRLPWASSTSSIPRPMRPSPSPAPTGCAVGVISNSNGTVRALLGALGLARHLDFVIDSFEVGVEKPDPRIFALALAQAGGRAARGSLRRGSLLGGRPGRAGGGADGHPPGPRRPLGPARLPLRVRARSPLSAWPSGSETSGCRLRAP